MKDTTKSWLFVTAQALLLGLLVLIKNPYITPSNRIQSTGSIIKLVGVLILLITFYDLRKSLTALPLPKENGELQVRGLYRFVRHPMYVGVLMLALGIAVSSGSPTKYLFLLALFGLFSYKARYEEILLKNKYPGYKAYMQKTPRFIPRLRG